MKKIVFLSLLLLLISNSTIANEFTFHDKLFSDSRTQNYMNSWKDGTSQSTSFKAPSGAEAFVVNWNLYWNARPSIKHKDIMNVLEIAGNPIGKKKNFKSRANGGTPASYKKYTSSDNRNCFTFFNIIRDSGAIYGYVCNKINGDSFNEERIKDLIDSLESNSRKIPDSLKNKKLVAKKLQDEIKTQEKLDEEYSKIRINTDPSLRARISAGDYCLDKRGKQRECDWRVDDDKWHFFYLKKIGNYHQIIEASSNECLGSKGKFIKRYPCSQDESVLWEINKFPRPIKNIGNGKCMVLREDNKTYLMDCSVIDPPTKHSTYEIEAIRDLEWDNKGVFIENDENNIVASSQSSADSNCLDNLDNLSDEEFIACGVAQGWVDEETGIVTPPDSSTSSSNQETESSNTQNYELTLTVFWDEIGDGIEASMSVADNKGTSGTVVLKDSKLGLDCSGGWSMTKGSFSGPEMPSGQWVLTCTNGLIANGKIKAKETYLGSGVGTDNKGRNIQFIYQRN